MARGNQQDNYTNFYVKLVGLKKGSKECFFEFKQKKGDKYEVVDKQQTFEGLLETIKVKEIEHEGKKKPVLEIILRDDIAAERYFLNMGMSNISRQLISCLHSAESLNHLSFWTKMGDNGFPILVTKANNSSDKLQWGLDMKELSAKYVTEHKVGDDIIRVYKELDNYLLTQILPGVISKIVQQPKASIMTVKDSVPAEVVKPNVYEASEEESDDDLPF